VSRRQAEQQAGLIGHYEAIGSALHDFEGGHESRALHDPADRGLGQAGSDADLGLAAPDELVYEVEQLPEVACFEGFPNVWSAPESERDPQWLERTALHVACLPWPEEASIYPVRWNDDGLALPIADVYTSVVLRPVMGVTGDPDDPDLRYRGGCWIR
jgi:hypothetical protein